MQAKVTAAQLVKLTNKWTSRARITASTERVSQADLRAAAKAKAEALEAQHRELIKKAQADASKLQEEMATSKEDALKKVCCRA